MLSAAKGQAGVGARVVARVRARVSASDRASERDADETLKFIPRHCFSAGMLSPRVHSKGSKALLLSSFDCPIPSKSLELLVLNCAFRVQKLISNIITQQWLDPRKLEALLVVNLGGRKPQSTRSIPLPSTIATRMASVTYRESHKSWTTSSHWEWT